MIAGFANAAHRGHHRLSGCVAEWQAHCQLGVHPHPVEPSKATATSSSTTRATPAPQSNTGGSSPETNISTSLSVPTTPHTRRRSSSMLSRRSSGRQYGAMRTSYRVKRYFAIFGAGVVYSTREAAKAAFDDAIDDDGENPPELLSTDDLDRKPLTARKHHVKGIRVDNSKQTRSTISSLCLLAMESVPDPLVRPIASSTEPPHPDSMLDAVPTTPATQTAQTDPPPEEGAPVYSPGTLISDKGEVYIPALRPSIVQREKTKRSKRKGSDEPAAKPGKPSWIWGTKLKFFESRKSEWVKASEGKGGEGTGAFYTKMAKLYTTKYGFDLGADEDFERDVSDPPDWVADKVVNEVLTAEETAKRQEFHSKLRELRKKQRLGQWYRGQYTTLLKDDKTAFGDLFSGLTEGLRAKPRRPRLLQFYLKVYYETRVKARAEARIEALDKRAKYTGADPPHALAVQNDVTKECWEGETEIFKAETARLMEREYEATLKAWEASLADSPSRTAEEYNASLKTAAYYLQPFCDAIQERYGIVHSGKTRDLLENDWPRHDPDGFTLVEASMVNFAHSVFTQAECDARTTGVQVTDGQAPAQESTHSTGAGAPAGRSAPTRAPGERQAGSTPAPAPAHTPGSTPAPTPSAPTPPLRPAASASADNFPEGVARKGGAGGSPPRGDKGEGENGGYGTNMEDGDVGAVVQGLWRRNDRSEWNAELVKAHAAFERMKIFGGVSWASCVQQFFDFEKSFGYEESGPQITKEDRPPAVNRWLQRGRKWDVKMDVGMANASGAGEGATHAACWWKWWAKRQPKERGDSADSMLGRPEEADWSGLRKLHGRNSLLQVMAALLWWGEEAAEMSGLDQMGWFLAVDDVTWALGQMLRPRVLMEEEEEEGTVNEEEAGRKEKPRGKKRKAAEVVAPTEPRRGRSATRGLKKWDWDGEKTKTEKPQRRNINISWSKSTGPDGCSGICRRPQSLASTNRAGKIAGTTGMYGQPPGRNREARKYGTSRDLMGRQSAGAPGPNEGKLK
ncbi:hypothetical protein C8F04DRAFT_1192100 [Mycena alexandri]|uniref:Uncharacterized protein n=1 Tax=Mycena alexandri TaxID=1745969 RepID=A0AAD6SDP1_9AGAR|nr:hypothetical protein C8F04DRAFT_1192100 [Mycena alexandri]